MHALVIVVIAIVIEIEIEIKMNMPFKSLACSAVTRGCDVDADFLSKNVIGRNY